MEHQNVLSSLSRAIESEELVDSGPSNSWQPSDPRADTLTGHKHWYDYMIDLRMERL